MALDTRPLDTRPLDKSGYPAIIAPSSFGAPPKLEWLAIRQLVIDPEYQRDLNRAGRSNVARIARAFDWSKFAPVIVAPAGSDRFAIVDGQHRTTAALLAGVERVPCSIIDVSRAQQAASFAAVNGMVTRISSLQVFTARLAAGDEKALALREVCAAAGVRICRYPVQASEMKVGWTLAVSEMARLLVAFGAGVFGMALSVITATGERGIGLVRGPLVHAIALQIEGEAKAERVKLVASFSEIDLRECWDVAVKDVGRSQTRLTAALVDRLGELLDAVAALGRERAAS